MATKISKYVLNKIPVHALDYIREVMYIVIDDKLTEVKLKRMRWDIDKSNPEEPYAKETIILATPDGNELNIIPEEHKFYESPSAFEKGMTIVPFVHKTLGACVVDGHCIDATFYICDGKNIKEYTPIEEVEYIIEEREEKGYSETTMYPPLPETMYSSREEAFKYNDYEVHNLDGTVTVKHGYARGMRYNEEQQKLVDEFLALNERMNEHGLRLCYDLTCYGLSIVPYNGFVAFKDMFGVNLAEDEISDRDIWKFIVSVPHVFDLSESDEFVFKKEK